MLKEFAKYDKKHHRVINMSVHEFNNIIKETEIYVKTKREEEKEAFISWNETNKRMGKGELSLSEFREKYVGVAVSVKNNRKDNIPVEITIANFLGVKTISFRWHRQDGDILRIEYIV